MEEGGGSDQFAQNRPKKASPAFRAQCEGFPREKQTRLGGGSYLIKDVALIGPRLARINKPETWILKVGRVVARAGMCASSCASAASCSRLAINRSIASLHWWGAPES